MGIPQRNKRGEASGVVPEVCPRETHSNSLQLTPAKIVLYKQILMFSSLFQALLRSPNHEIQAKLHPFHDFQVSVMANQHNSVSCSDSKDVNRNFLFRTDGIVREKRGQGGICEGWSQVLVGMNRCGWTMEGSTRSLLSGQSQGRLGLGEFS